MRVTLKSITPNAELNIVEIARVSSTREDKSEKPEGLINYLIEHKHFSPFEHSSITFEIVTSKAIGIQLLRHRSFTFQEFSQRYAKVENMEPIELRYKADKNRQSSSDLFEDSIDAITYKDDWTMEAYNGSAKSIIDSHIRTTQNLYNALLDAGIAKECARMILPMCSQTTLYMTGTIRSWIHMLQIGDDAHAQLEVQLIAKEIKKLFIEQCPIISKALGWI